MERLTLCTHAANLDYLHTQLAEHYGPITQTGLLDWLASPPAAPTLRLHERLYALN